MRSKIDRVGNFGRACLFELGNIRIGPNNLRAICAVELLDALAGVGRDLTERVDGIGENTRQNLHTVVSGARLVGPLVAPATNQWPDFLGPIELGNAKLPKIFGDAVQPRPPVARGRGSQFLVISARLVEHHDAPKAPGVWRSSVLVRLVV